MQWRTSAPSTSTWSLDADNVCLSLPPPPSSISLLQSITNHLRLGQWEFARALLGEFKKEQPGLARSVLTSLIANPTTANCVGSETVPTVHHLVWLCATEYLRLFNDTPDVPKGLLQHAELNVTLHAAFDDPKTKAAEEIRQYHHFLVGPRTDRSPPKLSSSAVAVVVNLLELKPAPALALCTLLVGGDGGLPLRGDAELRSQLLGAQASLIAHALETADFGQATDFLGELQLLPGDIQEIPLDALVKALVSATDPFGGGGGNAAGAAAGIVLSESTRLERRQQVETALLDRQTPFLIQRLCKEEEQEHAALFADNAALAAGVGEPDFWGKYFLYASATGKHVLEREMEAAISFIADRDFSALQQLLSPPSLRPLKPLALLAGWSSCADDPESAEQLMVALHPAAAASAAAAAPSTSMRDVEEAAEEAAAAATAVGRAGGGVVDGVVSGAVHMAC